LIDIVTYRPLVPLVDEEHEPAVDDQQEVDDDEQVVRVPEGVEAGEVGEREEREPPPPSAAAGAPAGCLGLLPLPEWARGEGEGDGHERDHDDPRDALGAGEEAPVAGLVPPEEARHQPVLVRLRRDQPGEVARQVGPLVQAEDHSDSQSDDLSHAIALHLHACHHIYAMHG